MYYSSNILTISDLTFTLTRKKNNKLMGEEWQSIKINIPTTKRIKIK